MSNKPVKEEKAQTEEKPKNIEVQETILLIKITRKGEQIMNASAIKFKIKGRDVIVSGYPELENCIGILDKDGMAFFFGDNRELYVANTKTGKIRQLSSSSSLLVDDSDIDIDAIEKKCANGINHARRKEICYARLNRWDGFKAGVCAITWTLYPDGRYFADSDGFGMEDNDEEEVYAIIDTNLNIIEPFRPIKDIAAYLKELRKNNCKSTK